MRLSVRLLGWELLTVDLAASEPEKGSETRLEASGGGQFELAPFGFEMADDRLR